MTPAPLRPLRVGEILDTGLKLYLRKARTLMAAAATVVIPLQVVSGLVLLSTYSSGNDIPSGLTGAFRHTTVTPAEAHARLGAAGITNLASLFASALVTAACIKAVSDTLLGQPTSAGGSLRFALRRLPALVAALVLVFVCVGLATIALVIPGIWMYAALSVAIPALLIERLSPPRALGRSRRLVSGRWWPTAGVLLVVNIMTAVLGGIASGLLAALALTTDHPSVLLAVTIGALSNMVSGIIIHPLTASVTTVLYYDLRVRREGYDLELLAEQLGLPQDSLRHPGDDVFTPPPGPDQVGQPGGPPFWPPPPGWRPGS